MTSASGSAAESRPTLLFVGRRQCGASRRMESLIAWVKVTKRKRLRVVEVDADRQSELVERLGVTEVPALVLVDDAHVVDRLEGRVTGKQIEEFVRPHLAA